MTEKPWGYVDPGRRVHEQQALRNAAQPSWPVQPMAPVRPVQSPLANLPMAEAQVVSGNGPGYRPLPQRQNVAESMVAGAVVGGFAGMLAGKLFARRRARKTKEQQAVRERLGIADVE